MKVQFKKRIVVQRTIYDKKLYVIPGDIGIISSPPNKGLYKIVIQTGAVAGKYKYIHENVFNEYMDIIEEDEHVCIRPLDPHQGL